MKSIISVLVLSFLIVDIAYSQINHFEDDFINDLKNAQVVFLGEPDHFSTSEMQQKVELVKFLHDSLGYQWLAFESSIYDMHKANELYLEGYNTKDALFAGIFPIWHSNEAIKSLINYLDNLEDKKSLQLVGFDSQINSGTHMRQDFSRELASFLEAQQLKVAENFMEKLQKEITAFDTEPYPTSNEFDPSFLEELNTLTEQLSSLDSKKAQFYQQILLSLQGLIYDYCVNNVGQKADNGSFISTDTNLRDSLMAQNLLWFLEKHPDVKVVAWGASFHFANDLSEIESTTFPHLSATKPMGYHVKKALKDKAISIGFVDLKRSSNASVSFLEERKLYNGETALINFKKLSDKHQYSALIGLEFNGEYPYGNWSNVLDYGIVLNSSAPYKYESIIVDANNREPIPFVHLKVNNSNTGTLSNENGIFRLLVPPLHDDKAVSISSVGYKPIELAYQDLKDTIQLESDIKFLKQVEVIGKREMPIDLLQKVSAQFVATSMQETYQMGAYYYSWWTEKNTPADTAVNEAAIKLIYKNAYRSNQEIQHTIQNTRRVHGKKHVIPWPVHTLLMADFSPGYALLHPKIEKHLQVDSLKYETFNTDTLYTYFYSIDKPIIRLVGSGADTYRAQITFSAKDLSVQKKSIFLSHSDSNWKAAYHISYETVGNSQIPSFAWMQYEAMNEGVEVIGKEAIRITNFRSNDFDPIEKPIIELSKAPYDPDFWINYNRIFDR